MGFESIKSEFEKAYDKAGNEVDSNIDLSGAKHLLVEMLTVLYDVAKEMIGIFWESTKMILSEFWAMFTKKKGY